MLETKLPLIRVLRSVCAALIGLLASIVLSGCMAAKFSSGGSDSVGFIWPGLGLVFVLLVVLWFLLRRR